MSQRREKTTLFSRSLFILCAIVFAWACNTAPSQTAPQTESSPASPEQLESVLAEENTESAECRLERNCCGDLDCAPAPCPIFCPAR